MATDPNSDAIVAQLFDREWRASERRFAWIRLSMFLLVLLVLLPLRTYIYGAAGEGGYLAIDLPIFLFAVAFSAWLLWRLRAERPPRWLGVAGILLDYLTLGALIATLVRTDFVAELGLTIETYKLVIPLALTVNVLAGARLSRRQVLVSGICCALLVIGARVLDVLIHGAPIYVFTNVLLLAMVVATSLGANAMVAKARALIGEAASRTSEARHVRDVLSRYLSEPVVDLALREQGQLGAVRKARITVMFVDIRSFTTISEALPPEELVVHLNAYFSRMVDALFRFDGMLDKYIGDGIMALFGAILPQPDHAQRAVQAAIAMRHELKAFNRDLTARGYPNIRIGIGLHTGDCVVGNIGAARRLEFTAIGDVVNTASRIEGLTKTLGADILISADCHAELRGGVPTRKIPAVEIRGRKTTVDLYAVEADAPPIGPTSSRTHAAP